MLQWSLWGLTDFMCCRAQYNGVWHCFVGRNMGAYMTYESKHYIYFYIGQTAVLLFKTG
jgi:dynein light chain LC8-type